VGFVIAGCGGDDDTTTVAEPDPTTTQQTNGDGGDGPPPVGDGEGGVQLAEIGQFEMPVYVTQPTSGDAEHLYVVEQCGTIRRLPIDGGSAETFLDIGDLVTCGGEQGLLSMAFAPTTRSRGASTSTTPTPRVTRARSSTGDRRTTRRSRIRTRRASCC